MPTVLPWTSVTSQCHIISRDVIAFIQQLSPAECLYDQCLFHHLYYARSPYLMKLFKQNRCSENIQCRAIPQKRLPQGEKMKVTYKVCFPLKINEEGLHFDDEVKKVVYIFQPSKETIFYKNCSSKNML